jgi:hypothetical protein
VITLERGLTTSRAALADTLNAAAECAERTGRAAGLDEVRARLAAHRAQRASLGLIITDDGLEPATVDKFLDAGVNLVVAERRPAPTEDPKAD